MHVRSGGAAGAAEEADLAVPGDMLPDRDRETMQVGVAGGDAVTVVDLDDLAVIVAISGEGHDTGSGGIDRGHVGGAEIEPGVIGGAAVDRIAAHPEAAADLVALQG